jgi:hypothetical protein
MDRYLDLQAFCAEAHAAYAAHGLFCLADHAGMPGLHRELVRSSTPWCSLFERSSEENALTVAPLLFALDGEAVKEHSHLLRWVAEHGTFTSSMLLLASPLTLPELGRRLALRLQAEVSEQMPVLLRYFDPRIFEALVPVLTAEQKDVFLGAASCWWYPDRCGQLVRAPTSFSPADTFVVPLRLSANQEFALLDASEVDQVAEQLASAMPENYRGIDGAQRYPFLKHHMAAAIEVDIEATHELALYCGLAMLYGNNFSQLPQWQTLLDKVRSGNINLSDAVANEES